MLPRRSRGILSAWNDIVRIERLYRYPVKGLTAEALEATQVEPGRAIPWDRAFALAQGDALFDPEQPGWRPKTEFMCLRVNAAVAALRSSFDPATGMLLILAPDGARLLENALSALGRERIGAWLTAYLGAEARGAPRFHHIAGHTFGDQKRPVISLISLASLADYEAKIGARRHKRRFRANIWFDGAAPTSEREWVGRELLVGSARLRVTRTITRCPATEVNPLTAERDADPVAELKRLYGHTDLGIHAEVVEAGRIAAGDAIELLS